MGRLDGNAIAYLYLVHHHVCIKMFNVGVVHQPFFREHFVVLHVLRIHDHHKILAARNVVTLHHFTALQHGGFEFFDGLGVSPLQHHIHNTGDADAGNRR